MFFQNIIQILKNVMYGMNFYPSFLFSFLLWLGVNFILRKLAQAASLYVTMVISMEDGQLRIQNKGPKNTDHKAPLGTEIFITDLMHNPMKVWIVRGGGIFLFDLTLDLQSESETLKILQSEQRKQLN